MSGMSNRRSNKLSQSGGRPEGFGNSISNEDQDGISRMLNNINVQTRKAGDAPTTNLPPIGLKN